MNDGFQAVDGLNVLAAESMDVPGWMGLLKRDTDSTAKQNSKTFLDTLIHYSEYNHKYKINKNAMNTSPKCTCDFPSKTQS